MQSGVSDILALYCCCKTKKKVAVTFAVPMDESVDQLPTLSPGITGGIVEETETMLDSFDIVDERTSLLRAEGGSFNQTVPRDKSTGDVSGVYQTPELETVITTGDSPAAIGASNLSLASSSDDDAEWVDATEDRALTAASQSQSAPSTPRQKSSQTHHVSEVAVAPAPPSTTLVPSSVTATTSAGDMYHWMKRQQDFTASRLKSQHHDSSSGLHLRPPSESQVSWTLAGASDMSRDDSVDVSRQRYVTHSAYQLADAQVRFYLLMLVLIF